MRNVKNLALFMLMLSLVSTAAVADIHYVNPGESINAAISAADPGDEIAVMPGYYNQTINFGGKPVKVYSTGGPDVTVIDGTGYPHVVWCVDSEGPDTILEGFTITGGNATGIPHYYGGGMYNENAGPTVTNCIFTGNTAVHGGGMGNRYNSNPTVTNCIFSGNTVTLHGSGGGMYNVESSPTVTNCTFTGNTAVVGIDGVGGGMHNEEYSSPIVTNCTFSSNTAYYGGGMDNRFNSHPTVTNCTFSGNTANTWGGGMSNYSSSPTVTNCTFTGNTANTWGGGMHNEGARPTVTNCTFTGNTAIDGGGMLNRKNSSPTVTNCILWADSPDEIYNDASSPIVTYSDVQGGWPGTGNIDADPLFADADGRLSLGSPCIDAGNDAAVPPGVTTDLDGNPRIQGVCVDMGAFESDFPVIDFSGWVWMESDINFGYSQDEDDLLYFLSFGPVWYYNTAASQWSEEGPAGWTYVNWPFLYESNTSTMMFALPPESGLSVYHFRAGQWTISPRIIP